MDLISGLQAIFGTESPPSRQKNEQRSESAKKQEAEWHKKNIQLKEQLDEARERIIQLENRIHAMSSYVADEVKQETNDTSKEGTVMEQTRDTGYEKMNSLLQEMNDQVKEMKGMLDRMEQQTLSVDAVNETAERLRADIIDKVHAENVQCYRNLKGLVTDLEVKIEEIELDDASLNKIRKSFKGMKFFSFFAFLSFVALIVWWLLYGGGYYDLIAIFGR